MKFGKRLAAEAARCWPEACLDYKAIKRALKHDLATGDATATTFLQQLHSELNKVSRFYVEKAEALEATLSQHTSSAAVLSSQQLSVLRDEIRQLIKFVALNYLAVVKAIKKRNRHCKVTFGAAATGPALHPLDLLKQEVFFTSPRLAALSTHAELMAAAAAAAATGPAAAVPGAGQAAPPRNISPGRAVAAAAAAAAAGSTGGAVEVDDYQCPICLDVLRSPVVLNCAHRFCWGCLVAHCASITGPSHHSHEHAAAAEAAATAAASAQQPGHVHGSSCSHQQQQQPASSDAAASKDGASSSNSSSSSKEGLVVLEKLVSADANSSSSGCCDYYNCPVCRQPQVLNIDNLTVDPHLARFVDELRLRLRTTAGSTTSSVASELASPGSSSSTSSASATPATLSRSSSVATVAAAAAAEQAQLEACLLASEELEELDCKYLLPRPLPHHAGRLTVLLDLDGTLVSSFTPRRAPRLPPAMKSHLVGVGSSLNPGGVFVVERPGLTEFLAQLAGMSEVVVFTAGLEEYAAPIIDAIDPDNKFIAGRLYRPACTRTAHHQCIKDLHLLGRPLSRTVLVDDTPLAFLHQPANGVPVLGFRGDPDDRLLMEAVLPLLQTLAGAPDVQTVLERRFDMMNWFKRHGYPNSLWEQQHAATPVAVPAKAAAAAAAAPAAVQPADAQVLAEDSMLVDDKHKERCLLVFDFDKTLTDWDAGERLVSELAPELLPWLSSLQQPTNFVPITNEVLQEMARRGVSRDKLLTQLQLLGSELPPASVRMLRWAAQQGLPVRVLSDCNQVFINHILSGAKLGGVFKDAQSKFEVITNAAAFERIAAAQAADAGIGLGVFGRRKASTAAAAAPSYRLVIQPRHPESSAPHNCPLCPENLCKGAELRRLRFGASSSQHGGQHLCSGSYGRIVYAGDGANDICPALSLGPNDVVLARAGEALAAYAAAAALDSSVQQFAAPVYVWHTHEELAQLVREHSQAASN